MKRTIITFTVALAAFVLGYLFGVPKTQSFNSSAAIAAPAPVPAAVPMPHSCPNIHNAIGALQSAYRDLNQAANDFCGHKGAAMQSIRNTLRDLGQAENCQQCR
jgi:hypothetical protein